MFVALVPFRRVPVQVNVDQREGRKQKNGAPGGPSAGAWSIPAIESRERTILMQFLAESLIELITQTSTRKTEENRGKPGQCTQTPFLTMLDQNSV